MRLSHYPARGDRLLHSSLYALLNDNVPNAIQTPVAEREMVFGGTVVRKLFPENTITLPQESTLPPRPVAHSERKVTQRHDAARHYH